MAANVRMIFDKATGLPICVVVPNSDKQLDDRAWATDGAQVGVNVSNDEYVLAKGKAPLAPNAVWLLELAKPLVAKVSLATAALIDTQIALAAQPLPVGVNDPIAVDPAPVAVDP